jgi:hypothetical protein
MRIRADKARDMAINGATRKFYKEIKIACKEGKFCITFFCTSREEVLRYSRLAKGMGYAYVISPRDNWIDISW